MSTSRPTSVLIFLGACLAFTETLAGVAGKLDSKLSGIWILAFGSLMGTARLPTIDPAESRPADTDRRKLEEEQAKLKKKAGGS